MRPYNLYDEKMLSFNTLQFFIYTVYMAAYLYSILFLHLPSRLLRHNSRLPLLPRFFVVVRGTVGLILDGDHILA